MQVNRKWVYHRDLRAHLPKQVILWWENRRVFFNLVLGCTMVANAILMIACGVTAKRYVGIPIGIPNPPTLFPIALLIYAIAANAAYTGGWIVEILRWRWRDGRNMTAFGLASFKAGIIVTIVVTLAPALVSWATFLYTLTTR